MKDFLKLIVSILICELAVKYFLAQLAFNAIWILIVI